MQPRPAKSKKIKIHQIWIVGRFERSQTNDYDVMMSVCCFILLPTKMFKVNLYFTSDHLFILFLLADKCAHDCINVIVITQQKIRMLTYHV